MVVSPLIHLDFRAERIRVGEQRGHCVDSISNREGKDIRQVIRPNDQMTSLQHDNTRNALERSSFVCMDYRIIRIKDTKDTIGSLIALEFWQPWSWAEIMRDDVQRDSSRA